MTTVESEFQFSFGAKGSVCRLTVPVSIPMSVSVGDLVGRLVNAHNLPCYVEKDLHNALEKFISEETTKYHDDNAADLISKIEDGSIDIGQMADKWNTAFTQEHKSYATAKQSNDEVAFGEVYHQLIHSAALDTLLNLDHSYAAAVEEIITHRDMDLTKLQKRQREKMEDAVKRLGTTYTDEQVNLLAAKHFEDTQVKMYTIEYSHGAGWERHVHSCTIIAFYCAQMKTMHNLRLMCVDVLDLCRHKTLIVGNSIVPSPQRLQTAMSLYSNSISGLVLLVDDRINSYTGIKLDFAGVCQLSTDFHFPDLDTQLRVIQQHVLEANKNRTKKDIQASGSDGENTEASKVESVTDMAVSPNLQAGDFYITRHSSLAEIHTVFHLVVDENIRSSEISSRHPTIIGLRNVLKCASQHDVLNMTIPLFLVYEMSEEMTIAWCLKRAELVFKCVKGFMMEMTTWGGNDSRTIQFVVPKSISEDLFMQLSSMLPQIFRISSTVNLTRQK
ncbi:FERRY endosomal RAB5 effector complex subunit 3-like [Saccoglossus kowalevskii]